MATRQDFQVLAEKFRTLRPKQPNLDASEFAVGGIYEGTTPQAVQEEYEEKMEEWKFWRKHIMDACVDLNFRFRREWFIHTTETP